MYAIMWKFIMFDFKISNKTIVSAWFTIYNIWNMHNLHFGKKKPKQTIHLVLHFFLELGSRCQVRAVSVYWLYICRLNNPPPPKKIQTNKQKKKTWRLYRSHADSTCNKSGRHIWSNLYFLVWITLNDIEVIIRSVSKEKVY